MELLLLSQRASFSSIELVDDDVRGAAEDAGACEPPERASGDGPVAQILGVIAFHS